MTDTAGSVNGLGRAEHPFARVVPPLNPLQPLVVQVQKQALTVGNRIVGNMWVDGGGIRGEGGSRHPQLVLPLTIEMATAPEDAMMATVWVRGRLSAESITHRLVTQPVSEMLVDGFPARSLPVGTMEHRVELRFFLAPPELEAVEAVRHANTGDLFELYVAVDAVVAALQAHNELKPGQQSSATPWNRALGPFLQVLPFWSTRIMPIPVRIEGSKWTRDVLPGLGYDRSRLLEITFPPPLPDHQSAASEWDRARRAFDERRYGDCVAECRDLLSMWRKELGATRENPISAVIAKRRRWSSTDARIAFVDGVWKSAVDVVNAPHHPEGQKEPQHFDAADARLILLLTAAVSAYLGD